MRALWLFPGARLKTWASPLLVAAAVAGLLLLSGCNTPRLAPDARTAPVPAEAQIREGRLFLRVDSAPPSITQADISLQGTAEAGRLTLYGPLGITHGELRWSPGEAVWSRGAEQQRYSSLDALLTQSLGTTLPVSTVLDWLDGRAVALDGWDLVSLPSSDLPLVARRRFPAPTLELRLRLTP